MISVIIPCYRVRDQITTVIGLMGPEVHTIYCVDDFCPENSGDFIADTIHDRRVQVLRHTSRQGVGGATITGYKQALLDGADIIIKVDGDGQMNPAYIPMLAGPLSSGKADYVKGNRFYQIEDLEQMPRIRLIGNIVLSFFSKFSSGYWDIFDPTNGFTAIQAKVLALLPLHKIRRGYFFESDMLFRLNTVRAVVMDIPMKAIYGQEPSSLKISKAVPEFIFRHLTNFTKRIFYLHVLRSFDLAALYLMVGLPVFLFGLLCGVYQYAKCVRLGIDASPAMMWSAGLPLLLGVEFILLFFHLDMQDVPRNPIHLRLLREARQPLSHPAIRLVTHQS